VNAIATDKKVKNIPPSTCYWVRVTWHILRLPRWLQHRCGWQVERIFLL